MKIKRGEENAQRRGVEYTRTRKSFVVSNANSSHDMRLLWWERKGGQEGGVSIKNLTQNTGWIPRHWDSFSIKSLCAAIVSLLVVKADKYIN